MSDLAIQSTDEATLGLSQWQRITNTFTAPSKAFDDIQRGHKSWWLPFILLVAATYILFAAITFQVGWGQVVENTIHFNPKTEARLSQLTPEQRASTDKMTRYFVEGTFIASPLLTLAEVALLSVGLWGTINFAFGGKAKFGSIFTVWMYASLPSIVTTLLGTVAIFAGGAPESFNIKNLAPTNIGAFLPPLETNKALYSLATSLDAVTIWTLVLLAIGTATVAGVKRTSGYIAVFGWWAVFVLAGAGIALITG